MRGMLSILNVNATYSMHTQYIYIQCVCDTMCVYVLCVQDADIIFMPYNYLLDANTRKTLVDQVRGIFWWIV